MPSLAARTVDTGNPIASIAGLATLKILKRPGAYEKLHATGNAIRTGLEKALQDAGIPAVVKGEPVMFDAYFTDRTNVDDYRDTLDVNHKVTRRFNDLLRESGIFKGDSKFYISLAHDEKDVRHSVNAFQEAASIIAKELTLA